MKRNVWTFICICLTLACFVFYGCGGGGGGGTTQISITTSSLPGTTVGTAYSLTLASTGGAGTLTWSITSGSLPAGLTLSSSGVISGTATTVGTSTFTVTVTDSSNPPKSASVQFSITVSSMSITTASLPAATVGIAYSQTLAVAGGTSPYTWSVSVGALPAGLNLNSATGVISGTPTTSGTSTFTVSVSDSSATVNTATAQFSITVSAMTVTTTSLPAATVGTAYNQTLAVAGGTAPYTWSLQGGALPASLGLSAGGAISGTPTTAGISNFTVLVTDSAVPANTATKPLSITVGSGQAVPAAPTGVTATGRANLVTISWPAVTGATSYRIYFSTTSGVTPANGTPLLNATSPFDHPNLATNTTYYYVVTALNASGESAPSAQVSALTLNNTQLYNSNCSCHGSLANSNVSNRTVSGVQSAIASNRGGMGFLSSLTVDQIQAIVNALNGIP